MGALCAGKANNPAAIERIDMKMSKNTKTVTFSDPLTHVAPADLGSPKKVGSPKKAELESEVQVKLEAPLSVNGSPIDP
jgi:hypothetical protein